MHCHLRARVRHGRLEKSYLVVPTGCRRMIGGPNETRSRIEQFFVREVPRSEPEKWTVRNVFRRLSQRPDPWRDLDTHARPLPPLEARAAP